MTTFHEMGLPPALLHSLDKVGFTLPTPIQAQAIPIALQQKDILGSATTGTGKTLAFAIPLIATIIDSPTSLGLIITPTRELAQQVSQNINHILGAGSKIKSALLIGGESIGKQFAQLKRHPQIIVGTPGRIIDHLKRKTFKHHNLKFLILDEMDRMFDMGFGIQIEEIISQIPKARQTLMFSATLPSNVEKLAKKYLNEPERISIGETFKPAELITQEVLKTTDSEKFGKLVEELKKREGSAIIFVKTKMHTESIAEKLNRHDLSAIAMHGDLRQNKRAKVINDFRKGSARILVATDIAARGLDIPHVQHVINYDLPQCPEDYIHRIGRTARAGTKGFALCFVTPADNKRWKSICKLLGGEELTDSDREIPGKRSNGGGNRQRKFGKPGGFGDRKFGEKKFGDKPFGDRKFGDKPFGERKFGEKKFGDKPFGEKKFGDKKFGDKPFGERKFGEKKFGDKPFGEKKFGEKKFGDKPFGEKKFGEKKFGDKPFGEKKFGEKKFGDKPFGEKKFGDKKFGNKPFGEKKFGAKKFNSAPKKFNRD
jgi:ATP-dependent RNA helicase DeaD